MSSGFPLVNIEVMTTEEGRVYIDANDLALHMRQQIALVDKQAPDGNVKKAAIAVMTTYVEWLEGI